MVQVQWYRCNCEWLSKYCDDHHAVYAHVPESVLDQYRDGK